jgi:hypothetical protein
LPGFEHLAPSRAEGVTIAHFASRGRGDWRQGPPSSAPANENALVTLAEYRYLRCITWRLETGSGEASYSGRAWPDADGRHLAHKSGTGHVNALSPRAWPGRRQEAPAERGRGW